MKNQTWKAVVSAAAIAAGAAIPMAADASSITIDSVTQRWPWNNKVDITYTITDGQTLTADPAGDVYAKIVFTATIAGQTYTIDGVTDIGASANSGTHTVTWTPPTNLVVKATDCTMSAQLLSADAPSGDDYMIIDLTTPGVVFEGLLHSQELSNARYNTEEYKTDKLVLRKIPMWSKRASLPNAASLGNAGYPTGHSSYSRLGTYNQSVNWQNPPTNWVTKADFYMGVFPITQTQYKKVNDYLPSNCGYTSQTNSPVNYVKWTNIRVSAAPDERFPRVTSRTGSFLQRLNYFAENKYWVDLPTAIMSEITARAGSTSKYWWGDTQDTSYAWVKANAGGTQHNVGEKPANPWGFYDVCGNGYEWCLDDESRANLASAPSAFSPASGTGTTYRLARNGGGIGADLSQINHDASFIICNNANKPGTSAGNYGIRVAVIME